METSKESSRYRSKFAEWNLLRVSLRYLVGTFDYYSIRIFSPDATGPYGWCPTLTHWGFCSKICSFDVNNPNNLQRGKTIAKYETFMDQK